MEGPSFAENFLGFFALSVTDIKRLVYLIFLFFRTSQHHRRNGMKKGGMIEFRV